MLHERLRHATQGQGQVLGLAGEPGIGKSRLLYEFRQGLGGRPVTYAEGHCWPMGAPRRICRSRTCCASLCGIAETDGPEDITRKVYAHLHAVGLMPAEDAIPPVSPGPDGRGRPTGRA